MTQHLVVRRAGLAVLVTVAVAVVAGCSSGRSSTSSAASTTTAPTAAHRYVGTVAGTAALVAVVVDGSRALAYVCDGVPGDPVGTAPTLQVWFNGPSNGRVVDVQQAAGRLRVDLTDAAMTGTLTLADGRSLTVTGTSVSGDAGLYRAATTAGQQKVWAGWILAADGTQRGGVGNDSGSTVRNLSGVRRLNTTQLTFSGEGIVTAQIAKVGITPIPIP